MKVIIDIPEDEYNIIKQFGDIAPNKTHSLAMEIANGEVIPDNATNGNVIKFIFPDLTSLKFNHNILLHSQNLIGSFSDNWWDSSYEKGDQND